MDLRCSRATEYILDEIADGFASLRPGTLSAHIYTVLCRLSKWLAVIALVITIGGHWAILQSAAWVGMAVEFSKEDSLSVALIKTFNGKNPCQLCKFVSESKKSEKESEAKFEVKKLDSFALHISEFHFPPLIQKSSAFIPVLASRSWPPLTPPPLAS